jgi:Protein of unknown function (DUF2934)
LIEEIYRMASRRTPSSDAPASKPRTKAKSVATPEPISVPPDVTMDAMPPSQARAKRAAIEPPTISADRRRGMIAEIAYLRAERRGFAPGGEEEDWLAAEAEVDRLLSADRRAPQ